jgi:hypothetical protein
MALAAMLPAQATNAAQEEHDSNVWTQKNGREILGPIRHPSATSPSFTLSIRGGDVDGPRYEFRVGSMVVITISMTNIASHDIDYSSHFLHGLIGNYNYLVWDEDGEPAEKKSFGDPGHGTSSQYWSGISPSETKTYAAELDLLYKFDRPGKYTVQVSRPDNDYLDENGKPVLIKSNTITITITG